MTNNDDGLVVEYQVRIHPGFTVFVAVDLLPTGPSYSIETDGVGKLTRAQFCEVVARMADALAAADAG